MYFPEEEKDSSPSEVELTAGKQNDNHAIAASALPGVGVTDKEPHQDTHNASSVSPDVSASATTATARAKYSPSASRRMVGSDFTVSLLLYLLCSLVGCAYSIIMAFDNYNEAVYVGGSICTLIYTFGVLFTWYGCYPHRLSQDNFSGSHDFADVCIWLYRRLFGLSSFDKNSPEPRVSDDDDKFIGVDAISSNADEANLASQSSLTGKQSVSENKEEEPSIAFGVVLVNDH